MIIIKSPKRAYLIAIVIKSHLYWGYTLNPEGVLTCELYTGQIGSNGLTSGPLFYIVQYQIADFMDS